MDYKERLINEYKELKEKCEKLQIMLDKYWNGELEFTPNCPYNLLHEQYIYMKNYLSILSYRLELEV